MPKDRFENLPTKKQLINKLYLKIGTLRAQAEEAASKGDSGSAKRFSDLETETIGKLRKLAESKSRR